MLVVSWTGDEIEFYQGLDVPAMQVAAAFGLKPTGRAFKRPLRAAAASRLGEADDSESSGRAFKGVLATIGFVVFFAFQSCSFESCSFGGGRPPAPPPKQGAPAARLALGARGALAGQEYTVAGHAVVEIAALAGKFDRHEYDLVDATGRHALLIQGLSGPAKEWCLLRPETPPSLTALQAAALRRGQEVKVAGVALKVVGAFQCRPLAVDGQPVAGLWPGTVQYGVVAGTLDHWAIARWTESTRQVHSGRTLPEQEVLKALASPAGAKR
jgi:hypothetical protein